MKPTDFDAMCAILNFVDEHKQKTFLLFHPDDFLPNWIKLGITQDHYGRFYFNGIRCIYSPFAIKGMVKELPNSILDLITYKPTDL